MNEPIHILSSLLQFVIGFVAEVKLGVFFVTAKEEKNICLVLKKMGHSQPTTPIQCDESTVNGIAYDTVKKQQSRPMEMHYFLIAD